MNLQGNVRNKKRAFKKTKKTINIIFVSFFFCLQSFSCVSYHRIYPHPDISTGMTYSDVNDDQEQNIPDQIL